MLCLSSHIKDKFENKKLKTTQLKPEPIKEKAKAKVPKFSYLSANEFVKVLQNHAIIFLLKKNTRHSYCKMY